MYTYNMLINNIIIFTKMKMKAQMTVWFFLADDDIR